MKKVIKIILVVLALMPFAVARANGNLVVEFETGTEPLFSESNFLPGESIIRWVKVTNNSGQTQRIATQPLNITDPNRLGDVLNLEIKEGGATLYNNALSNFFAGGENYLSSLANGAIAQYDFIISFYPGARDVFQGKSLGFDILVGFQGTEGGILPGAGSTSGGGGGGGGLPPGLTIQGESVVITNVTETSVIVTWLTSYHSTSQVIYAKEGEAHTLDLTDNGGSPPKYGYAQTTAEYDISPKVTFHSVTISGLTSGAKYYYRAISHGSLAISREYSFTTLAMTQTEQFAEGKQKGEGGEETPPPAGPTNGTTGKTEDYALGQVNNSQPPLNQTGQAVIFKAGAENGKVLGEETPSPTTTETASATTTQEETTTATGGWSRDIWYLIIIGLLILFYFYNKNKKEKERIKE